VNATIPATAAEQLRRLLLTIPKLDDDRPHSVHELSEAIGTDARTLVRDLRTLVDRNAPEPAGWYEPITLTLDADSVRLERPSYFRRPMALTNDELRALDLALAILRQEAGPDEHGLIDEARARLVRIAAAPDAEPNTSHAVHLGAHDEEAAARRRQLDACIIDHCIAELDYQRAGDAAPQSRQVQPLGFVFASGVWYLIAGTVPDGDLRVFRFDRIAAVRRTDASFSPPEDFVLDAVLRDGRVFVGAASEEVHVRYGPRIARWITEREGIAPGEDGSVQVVYPLADPEWALRHVLQYGPDAEITAPENLRALARQRLTELLSA
jgi:predicted DNA-binding transcriptional regulator YafY